MRKVYKFPLRVLEVQEVPIKGLVQPLTVQVQHGAPHLWAMVDTEDALYTRIVLVTVGTGHDLPDQPGSYLGTYQLDGGSFVGHVFLRGL